MQTKLRCGFGGGRFLAINIVVKRNAVLLFLQETKHSID
jgi:hypothetical protein